MILCCYFCYYYYCFQFWVVLKEKSNPDEWALLRNIWLMMAKLNKYPLKTLGTASVNILKLQSSCTVYVLISLKIFDFSIGNTWYLCFCYNCHLLCPCYLHLVNFPKKHRWGFRHDQQCSRDAKESGSRHCTNVVFVNN